MHFPDPKIGEMARLEQVIKGTKHQFARRSPGSRQRLPITPTLLKGMRKVWEKDARNYDNIMLWAAACLCYFGFLRAGEMTVPSESEYDEGVHLNYSDIAVDSKTNPLLLRVRIKASKTDPFRLGTNIFIGKTSNELCPVKAILAYLARRGQKPGFLFQFEDGHLLTRDKFVKRVKEALSASGVECSRY